MLGNTDTSSNASSVQDVTLSNASSSPFGNTMTVSVLDSCESYLVGFDLKKSLSQTDVDTITATTTATPQLSTSEDDDDGQPKYKDHRKRKYRCPYCPKRFSRPSSLTTHTYTHTGERPFACKFPNCTKRFSVISNLRRHYKVHYNVIKKCYSTIYGQHNVPDHFAFSATRFPPGIIDPSASTTPKASSLPVGGGSNTRLNAGHPQQPLFIYAGPLNSAATQFPHSYSQNQNEIQNDPESLGNNGFRTAALPPPPQQQQLQQTVGQPTSTSSPIYKNMLRTQFAINSAPLPQQPTNTTDNDCSSSSSSSSMMMMMMRMPLAASATDMNRNGGSTGPCDISSATFERKNRLLLTTATTTTPYSSSTTSSPPLYHHHQTPAAETSSSICCTAPLTTATPSVPPYSQFPYAQTMQQQPPQHQFLKNTRSFSMPQIMPQQQGLQMQQQHSPGSFSPAVTEGAANIGSSLALMGNAVSETNNNLARRLSGITFSSASALLPHQQSQEQQLYVAASSSSSSSALYCDISGNNNSNNNVTMTTQQTGFLPFQQHMDNKNSNILNGVITTSSPMKTSSGSEFNGFDNHLQMLFNNNTTATTATTTNTNSNGFDFNNMVSTN
ncbi:hypothetical protein H4219_005837 [Mycoemilia scoparia]|uniref:C2H2-type domain-containing protein n=1 Tax=Mycoemilia scoparia TaxID=417184 RepID=A0A9W7ZVU5_9FUNG|nr:hypothetical protein H4219_005837 [Mycoemilia scoparia]